MRAIGSTALDHIGHEYVMKMLDAFQISGPNGLHHCLVLEVLGSNIADFVDARLLDERLPGPLAKRVVEQTMLGISFLHELGIAHGGE